MSLTYKNNPIRTLKMLWDTNADLIFYCVESCVSVQTSWVTINDVVTQNAGRRLRVESTSVVSIIVVWSEGYHWRCRMFDKSMNATNASGPDLDRGVLPGQQAMVHCRNSVKVEDFLNSFFIHSIFVQTLSDMCVLLSPVRQGAVIQPHGWMCVTR